MHLTDKPVVIMCEASIATAELCHIVPQKQNMCLAQNGYEDYICECKDTQHHATLETVAKICAIVKRIRGIPSSAH